jgi:hypothetical protein
VIEAWLAEIEASTSFAELVEVKLPSRLIDVADSRALPRNASVAVDRNSEFVVERVEPCMDSVVLSTTRLKNVPCRKNWGREHKKHDLRLPKLPKSGVDEQTLVGCRNRP